MRPEAAMRTKAELQAAIRERRRAVLVVNTRSRRGRRHYPAIARTLAAAGFDLLASVPLDKPRHLSAVLDEAIAAGPDLLVAGGGDGTISQAARQLAHRDVALGVLPLGTTNNFARSLGLPLTVEGALGVVTDGKVADVDLGEVDGMMFANLVSIGMSEQVATYVPHRLKRVLGRAAYPLTALARLPGHRPFRAKLIINDPAGQDGVTTHELVTHQLNIANGGHHAGRPITADAGPDDRLLVVYAIGGDRRRHLVSGAVRHAATGSRMSLVEAPFLATDAVEVHTDRPMALDVDGEIRGRTPARITLAPQALRVMVAPDFLDT